MRFKPTRWVPKDSETFNHPDGLGVCYLYPLRDGAGLVGYGGKRNNHDFHFSYKSREKALEKIKEYFDSLSASAKYKADRREELRNRQPDPSNPSLAETAQLVRECLAQAFPRTKFSVRSESYSMGCSIDVCWTDGPTASQVNPILNAFERCGFDGMQDLKTYNGPSIYKGRVMHFGADYVQGQRTESAELLREAALTVAFECDLPLLVLGPNGCFEDGQHRVDWVTYKKDDGSVGLSHCSWRGENYAQLIYQVARGTSKEETQPGVELPHLQAKEEKPASDNARLAGAIWGEDSKQAREFEAIASQEPSRMVN